MKKKINLNQVYNLKSDNQCQRISLRKGKVREEKERNLIVIQPSLMLNRKVLMEVYSLRLHQEDLQHC